RQPKFGSGPQTHERATQVAGTLAPPVAAVDSHDVSKARLPGPLQQSCSILPPSEPNRVVKRKADHGGGEKVPRHKRLETVAPIVDFPTIPKVWPTVGAGLFCFRFCACKRRDAHGGGGSASGHRRDCENSVTDLCGVQRLALR